MANTFTQIHIQAIFAVKFREALILPSYQERLQKYITAILQGHTHKMININSMPDHIHILFGYRPTQALSDLMRIVKCESSEWINSQKFTPVKFRWQEGYGAFSYSKSQVHDVAMYVENQAIHHKKKTFLEEYEDLLQQFELDYETRYIFQPLI